MKDITFNFTLWSQYYYENLVSEFESMTIFLLPQIKHHLCLKNDLDSQTYFDESLTSQINLLPHSLN